MSRITENVVLRTSFPLFFELFCVVLTIFASVLELNESFLQENKSPVSIRRDQNWQHKFLIDYCPHHFEIKSWLGEKRICDSVEFSWAKMNSVLFSFF